MKLIKKTINSISLCYKNLNLVNILLAAVLVFTIGSLSFSYKSYATPLSDAQKELKATTEQVEEALDKYNAAQDEVNKYQEQIDELQAKIDKIEDELKPYREQLAVIAKWQYTTGWDMFMDMLFDRDTSFEQWLNQANQLEKISERKAAVMSVISIGEQEIKTQQAEIKTAQEEQQVKAEEAKKIADENQQAADALTEQIEGLREEQKEYLLGKGLSGGGPALDIPEEGDVVDYALSRVGCPYVWGGSGNNSFDCSGLVMWAYAKAKGMSLPHNSESLRACAKKVLPLSQAEPGDVLYRPGHVGIATKAGATEYVHAPTSGAYVRINDNNSWSKFTCALRF